MWRPYSHQNILKMDTLNRLAKSSNVRNILTSFSSSVVWVKGKPVTTWRGCSMNLDHSFYIKWTNLSAYTLRKFWRYNKASLGELVSLEILGKNQQGLTRGIWPRYIPVCIHISPGLTSVSEQDRLALPAWHFSWSEQGLHQMPR